MVSALDLITERIAAGCDRDTVGLWEVCAAIDRSGTEKGTREESVLAICGQLFQRPEIRCCQLDRNAGALVVWSGSAESLLDCIRAGYDSLAGRVNPGDVVRFATERYLNELVRPMRWEYDLAYGCFLSFGLTVLSLISTVTVARTSHTETQWINGVGAIMLLFVPVILLSFLALLAAIVVASVRLWRHWPLLFLSGISVLFIANFWNGYGSNAFQVATTILYVVGAVGMPGLWFLFLRRKYQSSYQSLQLTAGRRTEGMRDEL